MAPRDSGLVDPAGRPLPSSLAGPERITSAGDPYSRLRWRSGLVGNPLNPDSKVAQRERSDDAWYRAPGELYDKMLLSSPTIHGMVGLRIRALLDSEWSITPKNRSLDALRVHAWCEWWLDEMGLRQAPGYSLLHTWRGAMYHAAKCVPLGMQGFERIYRASVWRQEDIGLPAPPQGDPPSPAHAERLRIQQREEQARQPDGKTYWTVETLRPKPLRRWTFDEDGELHIVMDATRREPADPLKFSLSRWYTKDDNPWGDAALDYLYGLWQVARFDWMAWTGLGERFGHPQIIGKIDEKFNQGDDELLRFDANLASFQTENWLRLCLGEDVVFPDVNLQGSAEFFKGKIREISREWSKDYLGATMIIEESENGTQTMSAVLEGRFLSVVQADATPAGQWLTEEMRAAVALNMPGLEHLTPTFTLNPTEQKDLTKEVTVDKTLLDMGLPLDEEDTAERYGRKLAPVPELSVGWQQRQEEKQAAAEQLEAMQQSGPGRESGDGPLDPRDDPGGKGTSKGAFGRDSSEHPSGDVDVAPHGSGLASHLNLAKGQFAKGSLDVQNIARLADADRERVVADEGVQAALRSGFEAVLEDMRRGLRSAGSLKDWLAAPRDYLKGGIAPESGHAALATAIGGLVKLAWLRAALLNAGNLGFVGEEQRQQFAASDCNIVSAEPLRLVSAEARWALSTGDGAGATEFADSIATIDSLQAAIDRAESLHILTRPEFDRLDDWARSLAFTAAGQSIDTLHEALHSLVLEGLREGTSLEQMQEIVAPYWQKPSGVIGSDELFLSEAHVENVVRTNTMRAYQQGWNDIAFSDGMAERFPYAEVVAVLDERTSDVCRHLDGKLLDREAVQRASPPYHYQCRTVLVWLSAAQAAGRSVDDLYTTGRILKLPPKQQPMAGFGGYVPLFGRAA